MNNEMNKYRYFDPGAFDSFLMANDVVGFYPEGRKLKSGRESHWYVNCRNLFSYVETARRTAEHIIDFIKDLGLSPDYFYGVPEGMTQGAVVVNMLAYLDNPGQRLVMGRGSPKEHGDPKDMLFIGDPSGSVVILEDVTTTGSSLINAIEGLYDSGANVLAAVGMVNRMERRDDGLSVADKIKEIECTYSHMTDAYRLLPLARDELSPSDKTLRAVEHYFEEYGLAPVKLV